MSTDTAYVPGYEFLISEFIHQFFIRSTGDGNIFYEATETNFSDFSDTSGGADWSSVISATSQYPMLTWVRPTATTSPSNLQDEDNYVFKAKNQNDGTGTFDLTEAGTLNDTSIVHLEYNSRVGVPTLKHTIKWFNTTDFGGDGASTKHIETITMYSTIDSNWQNSIGGTPYSNNADPTYPDYAKHYPYPGYTLPIWELVFDSEYDLDDGDTLSVTLSISITGTTTE